MGRPTTSNIRNYYDYNKTENKSTCKICSTKLKTNHGTNLKKHLELHSDVYEQFIELQSLKTVKTTKPDKINASKFKQSTLQMTSVVKVNLTMKTLIDGCVEMVTVNGRPYSCLNDSGFRKIIDPILSGIKDSASLNSDSIRHYVHKEALFLQNCIKTEVKNKLISLKVDAASRMNRGFLGINLQYLFHGHIKLRTIGLVELTEAHSGIYLKDMILETLSKYGVQPKQLYTITSDNGANMVKAIDLVGKETTVESKNESESMLSSSKEKAKSSSVDNIFDNDNDDDFENSDLVKINDDDICSLLEIDESNDMGKNNWEQQNEYCEAVLSNIESHCVGDVSIFTGMRCVSHTLQLAVIDCLKEVSICAILNKVRALVKKLRNQTYMYLIKKEKLKTPFLDCMTRWHSTCDMLERLHDLKDFIKNMSANDKKLKSFCLSSNEWNHVETIFKALLPAKVCTKNLQSEQLTLTDFYGEWISCKFKTEAQKSSFSQKLLQCMISREKFILNNKVFISAIFLDPRYKITLSEEQCLIAIEHLIQVWIQINKLQSGDKDSNHQTSVDEHYDSSGTDTTDEVEQFLKSKSSEMEMETLETLSSSQTSIIYTQIENILKNYNINQKRIHYKTDILEFWKTMEFTHLELFKLASVVFCVPATQVSVERLFSGLKFVLSPYRTNISSKHLEDQLLIRTNKLFENKEKRLHNM